MVGQKRNGSAGIISLNSDTIIAGNLQINLTGTVISNAASQTYDIEDLLWFNIKKSNGGPSVDTTPVAAHIVVGLNNPVGTSFRFVIVNTNTAQDTLEISAGTGVTLSGTTLINPENVGNF